MFMGYSLSDFENYGVPLIIRLVVWGTSHFPAFPKCAPPRGYTLKMGVPLTTKEKVEIWGKVSVL